LKAGKTDRKERAYGCTETKVLENCEGGGGKVIRTNSSGENLKVMFKVVDVGGKM